MKDFRTLKFLDFFRMFFERFGIDYSIMRKILAIKLTMDGRRTPTIFNQQSRRKNKIKPEENGFIRSLGIYVFLSIFFVPLIAFGKNYLYQMSAFFGIVMFLVMTSMIADFSNVLLDIKDKVILQTKPIGKKTINAAKAVHISIYLFFLTAAVTGIPIVVGTAVHGVIFLILSIIGLILLNFFIVVLTAIIYYFILRFFDGEKLKDIINYVQIGLSIAIAIGYQILGRAFSLVNLKITFSPHWWYFLIPPFWFGAPFEMILNRKTSAYLIGFSIFALLIPIFSIMIYNRMMPSFEKSLQKLSNNSGQDKRKDKKWKNWLADRICKNHEEKIFYRFADNMMRNEREFRLKVYPALGMSLVFPFIILINQLQFSSFTQLAAGKSYLAIYMSSLMIPNAVAMLKYSGKYKGAWLYKTAPLSNLAPLYSASLKVFIVNLFLPVYFILCLIFIGIFGVRIIPDLLIVFVTSILLTVICSNYLKGTLPFSESFEDAQKNSGLKVILAFLFAGILAGIHFAVTFLPYGVYIYFLLLLFITILAWKWAYRTIWNF